MPAYYVDTDTMKCATPPGFGGGDKVWVDLTFNGVDFTDNKFEFNFYAFYGSSLRVLHTMPPTNSSKSEAKASLPTWPSSVSSTTLKWHHSPFTTTSSNAQ